VVTGVETWSWADLDARVSGAAAQIAGPEEPLAVLAATSPELVVLVLAALRAGRLIVPLSTRWTPSAVADALGRLGIERLVSDTDVVGIDTLLMDDALGEPEDGAAAAIPMDRLFTVVHTSGSAGRPKAIAHTVGNHVWSARGVIEALALGPDGRWLLDLPLYHVGGLGVVMRCVLAGAAIALPDRTLADPIGALRPTHASLVATQLRRLLEAGADLTSLSAVLLGGSVIPPDVLDTAVARASSVVVSYGMTEMTSTITATALGADRTALATSGRPLGYRALRSSYTG